MESTVETDTACKKPPPLSRPPSVLPSTFLKVPQTELTLALVKPDAVRAGHLRSITYTIQQHGFVVVASKHTQLTRIRAEEFYEDHEAKNYFDELTRFISSGPIYAFILGKRNVIHEWHIVMGHKDPNKAQQESPSSIRALYGSDIIKNAVHGSDSTKKARQEIKFFFPAVIVDPLPDEAASREYFDKYLRNTVVKGLTALAKAKPHSDPLQVITWLAVWLQENNPNKPLVDGHRPLTLLHA